MTDKLHFDTLAVHAGQEPDPLTGAVTVPIYQTSTYAQEALGKPRLGYEYARTQNPTRTALESAVATLENGKYGLAFASGMAAIHAATYLLRAGDHVLLSDDAYGGTFRLFRNVMLRFGILYDFVDMTRLDTIAEAIRPTTRLVILETPTNPFLKVIDITEVARLAHNAPAKPLVLVDNTFASPYFQTPLDLGADIVVHSSTKYLGGHSDVVNGVLVTSNPDVYETLKFHQNAAGAVPGPFDCWLVLRGLKTLPLRMERHAANALQIAQYLEDHPAIERVYYPGLESNPGHRLASIQMRGYSGMISFEVKGGFDAARQVLEGTKLFVLAESLGGVESLIDHPASMTHATLNDSPLQIRPDLLRLSVGVEHVQDLIDDLAHALSRL